MNGGGRILLLNAGNFLGVHGILLGSVCSGWIRSERVRKVNAFNINAPKKKKKAKLMDCDEPVAIRH